VAENAQPQDADLLRLVFEPGFSTADTVSEVSGRGVGLDVVQRNVTALRGTVAVASEPGKGTTITLRLPLTLAVIAGLNVRVADETFVIPLDAVVECIELRADEKPHEDGRGVVNLRGRSLPYISLASLFGLGGGSERGEVVVVRVGEEMAGLAVDAILGDGQTVIKPLGRLFREVSGVSGASLLGDGRVALILDVPAIVRRGPERAKGCAAGQGESETERTRD
jgi:two-component system chemotaxis sensor kinase CheA